MIVDSIWRQQPGEYFILATKSATGKWEEHPFKRGQRIGKFLEQHAEKDIWFCPHGFSEPKRLSKNAVPSGLLWADLDEADPRKFDKRLKPTMAWESSPGRYVGIWVVNRTVENELNRRLTYHIGADKGGWDYTQLLRIPGCLNHKYATKPKVRMLWDDGPQVDADVLERVLPKNVTIDTDTDAGEIYKQYEKKLPRWLRTEFANREEPPIGKRSEMFWKIMSALCEAGMTREEMFAVGKTSRWNKFEGKSNEHDQILREIDKIINIRVSGDGKKPSVPVDKKEKYIWGATTLDMVEKTNIDWMWYPYLARGELTILEGDPEAGKSYIAMMAAGALLDGQELPSDKPRSKPIQGGVVYFDLENDAGSVTKNRMETNGFHNLKQFVVEDRGFTIDDEDAWQQAMEMVGERKPALVVFDTMNTYIGKADTYKASESTQAIGRFKDMARTNKCAVIVLRHLTKGGKGAAMYRGQGSIAFTGMARVVMTAGNVPEDKAGEIDGLKALTVTKLNIGRKPKALTYTIEALPDTKEWKDRSKFTWRGSIDLTSDEMLHEDNTRTSGDSKQDTCAAWLQSVLITAEPGIELAQLRTMATAQGWNNKCLERAAGKIEGLKDYRIGGSRGPTWYSLCEDNVIEMHKRAAKAEPAD